MKRSVVLLAGVALLAAVSSAQAHWSVGVRFGGPVYRPYGYGYYHPWHYPPPVIIRPAPVYLAPVYAPAPVVVAQPAAAPATQSGYEPTPPPPPPENAPRTLPAPTPIARASTVSDLGALNDASAEVRAEAIAQAGKGRDRQAVAPITRALREDPSPPVRESAARALGLIALPASLNALQHAAQVDPDRDVRKTASFAADVIRANMKR
jgi:hypothetical protein